MNTEALFLFLILLLGLVLCSFLGGNCGNKEGFDISLSGIDNSLSRIYNTGVRGVNNRYNTNSNSSSTAFDNYNHYTKSSTQIHLQNGMTFTDDTGDTIVVITNSDGTPSLKLNLVGVSNPIILRSTTNAINPQPTFYAPDGDGITATIITDNNGQTAVKAKIGVYNIVFTQAGSSSNSSNPNKITSTQYYGSTGYPIQTSGSALAYQGPHGGSAGYAQGPHGGSAGYVQGPHGNTVAGASTSSSGYGSTYSSSLPKGIPASQIPPGQEDLYILKSQVVPPVCPACPACKASQSSSQGENKCPPCRPCGRCEQPPMTCKAVPNYNAIDQQYLPQPVISDFSSFGM
jgi:hypothetical protein